MNPNPNNSKQAGTFAISAGREVYGELCLAGPQSSLYLRDREFINGNALPDAIVGVLHDLTRVTLVNCVTTQTTGTTVRGSEGYHSAKVFPHFVLQGTQHLNPAERNVDAIRFVIRDATSVFHDFDAFGHVIRPESVIDQVVKANNLPRHVRTGRHAEILYFTGHTEIFSAKTAIGIVSANHNPILSTFGDPSGVALNNTIQVSISFDGPIAFNDAIHRLMIIRGFLGMLIGREQGVLSTSISIHGATGSDQRLNVYWSLAPGRDLAEDDEKPHPTDVLVDPIRYPDAFPLILASWVGRHNERRDARARFFDLFAKRRYDVDALIGLANVFDILPATAAPEDIPLSPELEEAKRESVERFRCLPKSPERDSVLGALGRLGKPALKHKIRHRANQLAAATKRFPDLELVTDEAVNCRNHYVHGSPGSIAYFEFPTLMFFFTDTLEFVFAASDLIDAGWDINAWMDMGTVMSHRFGRYRVGYDANLQLLRTALRNGA